MTRAPLVSVVLPVWNGERFLASAVDSILTQTFEAFELLLIDDGSTDATPDIATDFARRDPRVVVMRGARAGLVPALNRGIDAAQGRYVARMDADDVALPTRLDIQVAHLERHANCVAVGAAVEIVDATGRFLRVKTFAEDHAAIVAMVLNGAWPLAHPAVTARRAALVAVGGYDPRCYPSEDLDLWIRLSAVGELANRPEVLLRHRRHPAAVSVRERARQLAMGARLLNDARRARGLAPLWRRRLGGEGGRARNVAARYHFDCARTALRGGARSVALRHTLTAIVRAPGWLGPYAALLACALPTGTARLAAALNTELRVVEF